MKFPSIEKFPVYNERYDVGRSLYLLKGYEYSGINPSTGAYTYVDQNGDKVLSSPQDFIGLVRQTQNFFGGLSNTLRYRSLQLDVFFQFVQQTGASYTKSFERPGRLTNQPSSVMDRWRSPGDNALVQRFSTTTSDASTAYANFTSSDASVVDASFIRLKNAALSFQLPASWLQRAHFNSGRVFINGQNLLTFTNYVGLDPETLISQTLPPLRILTAGFQFTL